MILRSDHHEHVVSLGRLHDEVQGPVPPLPRTYPAGRLYERAADMVVGNSKANLMAHFRIEWFPFRDRQPKPEPIPILTGRGAIGPSTNDQGPGQGIWRLVKPLKGVCTGNTHGRRLLIGIRKIGPGHGHPIVIIVPYFKAIRPSCKGHPFFLKNEAQDKRAVSQYGIGAAPCLHDSHVATRRRGRIRRTACHGDNRQNGQGWHEAQDSHGKLSPGWYRCYRSDHVGKMRSGVHGLNQNAL